MARSSTLAVRILLGVTAPALAAFLPSHLPSGSVPDTFADATFTVRSTDDTPDAAPGDGICADGPYFDGPGRCTLRAAIEESNASPGHDTIAFEIVSGCIDFDNSTICQPGGTPEFGVQTISPRSPLPAITDPVVIDGTTQPGYRGRPLIELDGSLAVGRGTEGLVLAGGDSVVKGLVINRFSGGIWVRSDGNVIQGNFIGTDVSGTLDQGNRGGGVFISSGRGNLIGGTERLARNVISGNDEVGVFILGGGNRVQGNFVGTDASGKRAIGNRFNGVVSSGLCTSPTVIGGQEDGAGNVISGNGTRGILTEGNCALVQGNKIGTDVSGRGALGNGTEGVGITDYTDVTQNLIAHNGGYGLVGAEGVALRNSIYSNGNLGLDLWGNGLAPPSLASVFRARGKVAVRGSAHALPVANIEIEVFGNDACDPSGFGEGQFPLGSVNVTTDGSGDLAFSIRVDAPAGRFHYVTATVTASNGSARGTSSFSNCLLISR